MKTPQDVRAIVQALKELYPDGICSLQYQKDYELLFATRLSAQCTDERVNQVTPALFAQFPTLEALAAAEPEDLEPYIHSCGFFRAKARDIVFASRMLLEKYHGKVPGTMEELLALPGVGRKTANLILGDVHHTPGVVVADTHCIRITGLLAPKTRARWKNSCGPACPRRSPTTSATGWSSTAGRCAGPGSPTAPTASCAPGVTIFRIPRRGDAPLSFCAAAPRRIFLLWQGTCTLSQTC